MSLPKEELNAQKTSEGDSFQKAQKSTQHFTVQATETNRNAMDLLATESGFSKAKLKDLAQKGAVWLSQQNGKTNKAQRLRRLKRELADNQQVDLYFHPQLDAMPLLYANNPAILIKDFGDYSVWLKPRGMLSQGSKFADFQSLPRWIELRSETIFGKPRQCWQIHRLDRATEGLMLIAHSKKAAAQLTRLFEQKQIHKTYLAIVWGIPEPAEWTSREPVDGKTTVSHFKLLARSELNQHNISLIEVDIETGRKHQIRKHLATANLPIIGDRLHGNPALNESLNPQPDLQLSAYKLRWICPLENIEKTIQLSDEQLTLITKETR